MPPAVVLLVIAVLVVPGLVGAVPVGEPPDAGPTGVAASPTETPTPTPAGAPIRSPSGIPRIVAVYPNPYLDQDRGEFVEVEVPAGTDLGELTLTDGETVARLPNRTVSGRVALAVDPAAEDLTDLTVVRLDGRLRLANRGEQLELRRGRAVLSSVSYRSAPEGYRYRRGADGWAWHRLGATSFPVRSAHNATARLFVLPDAPGAAIDPLDAAERRVWLAAYELTSARVVEALCRARRRGVDVRVLVELEPVGGLSVAGAAQLDRLVACGIEPIVIGGPRSRYAFHHAKYAVVDDRAVVLTENWKPSGVGGRSSRGWGAEVDSPGVADALAETFLADAGFRDARPWSAVREGLDVHRTEAVPDGSYPAAVAPAEVPAVDVEVLVAPDNAEGRTLELLEGAQSSIRVIQMSVGGADQPFVRALVRAARRGVSVKLLLADVWYVRDRNRAVATELAAVARAEDLPLEARLATPRGRYGKIHAKGVVIDGDRVLVGSLNWNNASAQRNREVVLVLEGTDVGGYYAAVFDADWHGGRWQVPVGLVAVAAALAVVAGAVGVRSVEFAPEDRARVDADRLDEENPWVV